MFNFWCHFFISLFVFGISFSSMAQEQEVETIFSTGGSAGQPFSLPLYFNQKGEFSLLEKFSSGLSFQPLLQLGGGKSEFSFSFPQIKDQFELKEVQESASSMIQKKLRIEGGPGLSLLLKSQLTAGIIPYRGALHTTVRKKTENNNSLASYFMPKHLEELSGWSVGDYGVYQNYGGISAVGNLGLGPVSILNASFSVQGQFLVTLHKISKDEVFVRIGEENLRRRQFIGGPFFSNATFLFLNAKRINFDFIFSLNEPNHTQFFSELLKGNLVPSQLHLPSSKCYLTWEGREKNYFVGIPLVVGVSKRRGDYNFEEDDEKNWEMDIKNLKTSGFLLPLRHFEQLIYQAKDTMLLIWWTELGKASGKLIKKKFLFPGKMLGLGGFDLKLKDQQLYGAIQSRMILPLERRDFEDLFFKYPEYESHLKAKCKMEDLPCQEPGKLLRLIDRFYSLLQGPWENTRDELGFLVMQRPELLHAMIKTLGVKKKVYTQFLSSRYQSLEALLETDL